MIQIRLAKIKDLSSIVNIYNEAIEEGGFTADLEKVSSVQKEDWFHQTNTEQYGIYVLEEERQVIGYFYFSPWRKNRAALQTVAELSFYLAKAARGKGLGHLVLTKAIEIATKKSLFNLMAILLDCNTRSQKLLGKYGFEIIGHLPQVAQLKNQVAGQYIMLLKIKTNQKNQLIN